MEEAELRKRGKSKSVSDFTDDSQYDSEVPPVVSPPDYADDSILLSEEDNSEFGLTAVEKIRIKKKLETRQIKFFCEDILKGLATYESDRAQRGKALSERRLQNLHRIRAIVQNLKRYETKQEYITVIRSEISTIKGGKLIFNRNKSKLKDALNLIIDMHNPPVSFDNRLLYQEMSHYKKIQKHLNALSYGKAPKSGLESVFVEDDRDSVDPSSANNEDVSVGSRLDEANEEIARLRHKIVTLEEENSRLRNRRNVSHSAGTSGGDSKQPKSAGSGGRRISPPTEGRSESPTPASGDASVNRQGSGKKLPGGPMFSQSVNADAASEGPPKADSATRSVGNSDGTKSIRLGKSSSEGK